MGCSRGRGCDMTWQHMDWGQQPDANALAVRRQEGHRSNSQSRIPHVLNCPLVSFLETFRFEVCSCVIQRREKKEISHWIYFSVLMLIFNSFSYIIISLFIKTTITHMWNYCWNWIKIEENSLELQAVLKGLKPAVLLCVCQCGFVCVRRSTEAFIVLKSRGPSVTPDPVIRGLKPHVAQRYST